MQEYDPLIPIPETAKALGVAERTVRWWIQIGKIESNKLGDPSCRAGRRLVPLSEIQRLIRESRVPARVAA
jgi:hypothetical protein